LEAKLHVCNSATLRVLVVDDEKGLADVVADAARLDGWSALAAHDGLTAVAAARSFRPHAVILDLMLPDLPGLEVLRRLRAADPAVRVIVLTALTSRADRIAGLAAGADDYVAKPFSLQDVLNRLRRVTCRAEAAEQADQATLKVGDLSLDDTAHTVLRAGVSIELTKTEFKLLRFFMLNAGQVLSEAQILDRVWHYDFGRASHVVELYIGYLRAKLGPDLEPLIRTVPGGYTMSKPA
jgi:two-component system OmpR family response regulator